MTSYSSGSVSSSSVGSVGSSMSTNTTFSSLGSWLSELEPGADAAADAAGAGQRKAFGGENSERSSGSMSRWNGFSNGLVPQELGRLRYNRWRDAMDLLVAIGWLECKGGQCFCLSAAVSRPLQDVDSRAAMVSCCKSLSTTSCRLACSFGEDTFTPFGYVVNFFIYIKTILHIAGAIKTGAVLSLLGRRGGAGGPAAGWAPSPGGVQSLTQQLPASGRALSADDEASRGMSFRLLQPF